MIDLTKKGTVSPAEAQRVEKSVTGALQERDSGVTGVTQTDKIKTWLADNTGTITTRECDQELGFADQQSKTTRRQVFKRLVDAGELMRIKSKPGTFRILPPVTEVDKSKVDGTELNIGLPFGLEKHVRIFPKDIIILAGLSNVGKTALMLNLAWKNKQFECWYFSSEMGAVKCKDTIGNFREEPHFDGCPSSSSR